MILRILMVYESIEPHSPIIGNIGGDLFCHQICHFVSIGGHDKGLWKYSQTVLWGCPGGNNAKEEASTTRNELTPITLALESTTAIGSVRFPIRPEQ